MKWGNSGGWDARTNVVCSDSMVIATAALVQGLWSFVGGASLLTNDQLEQQLH